MRRSIGGSIPGTKLVGLPRLAVLIMIKIKMKIDNKEGNEDE